MYKNIASIVCFAVVISESAGLSTKMLQEVTGYQEGNLHNLRQASNNVETVTENKRPVLSTGKVPEVEAPSVEHVGLFYNLMFGNTGLGFDFGHSFDAGVNYKLPYYSDRQYLVFGTDLSAHLASFSWIQLITPILRGSLNLELNGVKIVPSLRGLFDT